MNNKVIYTANIGGYDEVIEPDYIPNGWDLICFTDKDLKSKIGRFIRFYPYMKITQGLQENISCYPIDGSLTINIVYGLIVT